MTLIALFVAALPLAAAINDPVPVDTGLLSGVAGSNADVRVFKGIPFAAPPVGDLRWRAPQPAAKWEGIRKADQFSSICMQTPYAVGTLFFMAEEPVSEDCLYLNIWTAAKSPAERLPVMVWIYGGALTRGSASLPAYDGEELARKGVVLVTFNYRLGVFGFLAHPELTRESSHHSSGNYGFLDQIAALEWVQRNIAAFGGDPKRVTIFGESAGSWSVNLLAATPLAKDLFQGAIGESGANFQPLQKLSAAEQFGLRLARSVGADSLSALRAKPAGELLKAPSPFPSLAFLANVDGWVLPEDIYTIFAAGKQNDVSALLGSNADEGTVFTPLALKADSFREQARRRFSGRTEEYLKLYPAGDDDQARVSQARAIRDEFFGWQTRTWARLQTRTGKSRARLYYFDRVAPGPIGVRFGAHHAAEIPYVFGTFNFVKVAWEAADRKLSGAMSSYWVNFAATGDPNGKALPEWPIYQEKTGLVMELGDQIESQPVPHKAALDFFDDYFSDLRGSP